MKPRLFGNAKVYHLKKGLSKPLEVIVTLGILYMQFLSMKSDTRHGKILKKIEVDFSYARNRLAKTNQLSKRFPSSHG